MQALLKHVPEKLTDFSEKNRLQLLARQKFPNPLAQRGDGEEAVGISEKGPWISATSTGAPPLAMAAAVARERSGAEDLIFGTVKQERSGPDMFEIGQSAAWSGGKDLVGLDE